MTQAGGSATINGILYQLLGTLDRGCIARMNSVKVKGEEIVSLTLIVEPTGGGGDLIVIGDGNRRVEQWKAKTAGGAWSLTRVIDDVLTDLYLALPETLDGDLSEYCFVTEGKMGKWQAAMELFQAIPLFSTSVDFIAKLGISRRKHTIGSAKASDRELFEYIVDRVAQGRNANSLDRAKLEERVRHLLARFKIMPPLSLDRLVAQINTFLRPHVDFREEVDGKRRELCGVLLEIASEGNVTITAEQLMRRAGIPLHTFRNWNRLRNRLCGRLASHLAVAKYDSALDVRPHPVGDSWVTAISGEGGQGKTWQLARFAAEAAKLQSLVVWVPSSRLNKDPAKLVEAEIWNFGLERDAPLELQQIAERRYLSNPEAQLP